MTPLAQRDVGEGGGARCGRRGAPAGVYRGVDVVVGDGVGGGGGERTTAAHAGMGGAAPGAGEGGVEVRPGDRGEGAAPIRGRRARGRGRDVLRRDASEGAARGCVHGGVDVRGRRPGGVSRDGRHRGVDVAAVRAGREASGRCARHGAGGGGGGGGGRVGGVRGQRLVGAPPLGDEEAQVSGADLVARLGVGGEGQVGVGRPSASEALVMLQKTEPGISCMPAVSMFTKRY